MLKLLCILVAQPYLVECGCRCVDGVPKSQCRSISEARRQPHACPRNIHCPLAERAQPDSDDRPQAPAGELLYFDAPGDPGCREIRIWDPEQGAYTGVQVCDAFTS